MTQDTRRWTLKYDGSVVPGRTSVRGPAILACDASVEVVPAELLDQAREALERIATLDPGRPFSPSDVIEAARAALDAIGRASKETAS